MASKGEKVLMFLESSPGQAVSAECSASIDSQDKLMTGFLPGRFFEIESFSCSAGLGGESAKPAGGQKISNGGRFAQFRSGGRIAEGAYPLELEPISIQRHADGATAALLKAYVNSTTFSGGAIVRRKLVGSGPRGYLRLDFTNILLISFGWSDGEEIKESWKFITRGLRIQYCPQSSAGSLEPPIAGSWPKS